jgi:hypothetical protein
MSFRTSSPGFEFRTKGSWTPPEPTTYGELSKAEYKEGIIVTCQICYEKHSTQSLCESRPKWPLSAYFARCIICEGFHPRGRCYFEHLGPILLTPSFCKNCQIVHIGYCREALFCKDCNKKHNFKSECEKQTNQDLLNNLCPNCDQYHTLHCPSELTRIDSDLYLWCNKCKIQHKFMTCVPFCSKCLRRHRLMDCPPNFTHCPKCLLCHQGEHCNDITSKFNKLKLTDGKELKNQKQKKK